MSRPTGSAPRVSATYWSSAALLPGRNPDFDRSTGRPTGLQPVEDGSRWFGVIGMHTSRRTARLLSPALGIGMGGAPARRRAPGPSKAIPAKPASFRRERNRFLPCLSRGFWRFLTLRLGSREETGLSPAHPGTQAVASWVGLKHVGIMLNRCLV